LKTAELKVLPVDRLKPAKYNPRKKLKPGDKEYKKIKDSIEEFGFADPLVVNSDMTIIGGHQNSSLSGTSSQEGCSLSIIKSSGI
jgi:site-specific DNA-methyltransferase (adenine-specific)